MAASASSSTSRAATFHLAVRLGRLAIGLVLLVAAIDKAADVAAFGRQVHDFRMLSPWLERGVAVSLPWLELAVGAALVLGVAEQPAAGVALLLLAAYTLAVAFAWARGLDFRCGCFGAADAGRIGATKFAGNAALTLLALLAAQPLRGRAAFSERT
ncbi:MAG TPA: MauE/DoxX family redox-associated membrane protein [Candidatus Acidoferrales bacterium]|nr:MauE/DoxX family redox-associated membrane protein [Candidatus Acidoferrales bacterium]